MIVAAGGVDALRERIGWLCQAIRFAAAAYAVWILGIVLAHWTNADRVARVYGGWLKVDMAGLEAWQRFVGFGVSMVIWMLAAAACYGVWRLFSGFLAGRIFTADASLWLRRIGLFGLAAAVADVAARPVTTMVMTLHLQPDARTYAMPINPNDLVFMLFFCSLIALAHIYKTAADIADDAAQIL
jgi:hypothetical protein